MFTAPGIVEVQLCGTSQDEVVGAFIPQHICPGSGTEELDVIARVVYPHLQSIRQLRGARMCLISGPRLIDVQHANAVCRGAVYIVTVHLP